MSNDMLLTLLLYTARVGAQLRLGARASAVACAAALCWARPRRQAPTRHSDGVAEPPDGTDGIDDERDARRKAHGKHSKKGDDDADRSSRVRVAADVDTVVGHQADAGWWERVAWGKWRRVVGVHAAQPGRCRLWAWFSEQHKLAFACPYRCSRCRTPAWVDWWCSRSSRHLWAGAGAGLGAGRVQHCAMALNGESSTRQSGCIFHSP